MGIGKLSYKLASACVANTPKRSLLVNWFSGGGLSCWAVVTGERVIFAAPLERDEIAIRCCL